MLEFQLRSNWTASKGIFGKDRGTMQLCAALICFVVLGTDVRAQSQAAADAKTTHGRVVALVTGSTDGLGREVAIRLGATGAHVIVHGRNVERGAEVVAQIAHDGKGSAKFYRADFGSLAEVREFANAVLRDYGRLDILVNNAGIGPASPNGRELSADGNELRFAVNYLSTYLLTRMLLARLSSSPNPRIVNVAAISQHAIDFSDLAIDHGYTGDRAYAQSKLALVMLTFDLADELKGTRVLVNALHPATLMPTSMVRLMGVTPRSTIADGADAVMYLITADGIGSGRFFNSKKPSRANAQAYDVAARESLRVVSARLTGIQKD